MARPTRENPFVILLVFLLLAAALVYFLILVWEIPSPAETNVQCAVSDLVFQGQDVPEDQLCTPTSG